jgi:hypothetical protein
MSGPKQTEASKKRFRRTKLNHIVGVNAFCHWGTSSGVQEWVKIKPREDHNGERGPRSSHGGPRGHKKARRTPLGSHGVHLRDHLDGNVQTVLQLLSFIFFLKFPRRSRHSTASAPASLNYRDRGPHKVAEASQI